MNVLITVSEFGRKLKQKNESISDFLFFFVMLAIYWNAHIAEKVQYFMGDLFMNS